MDFDIQKKKYLDKLYKPDNSKKGSVDEEIIPLIDLINKKNNYYTTSSCSGRITLFEIPIEGRKNEGNWLLASHQKVDHELMLEKINLSKGNLVWFRFESFILHLCARNLESADEFLKLAKSCGFKRGGITNTTPRIMIEIMTNERMDVPVVDNKKLLVEKEYLDYILDMANKKMDKNHSMIKKLEEGIKKL